VIVVFCGVGGVEPQSETVWRQADKFRVPRIAFVNKMDRVGSDFAGVTEQVRDRLGAPAVPLQLPLGSEEDFKGIIDLVRMRAVLFGADIDAAPTSGPIPDQLLPEARAARESLIEALADADDRIAEMYLEDKEPDESQIVQALRTACIGSKLVPVLCGAALRNKGVRLLLDAVADYLPSPVDLPPVRGVDPRDTETVVERSPRDSDPLSALAFKIAMDEGRKVVFLRVFSGVIEAGQSVYNARAEMTDKLARLFTVHADRRKRLERAGAGSIVVASGLKLATTGDTLCSENEPILFERIDSYEPVISIAIEPKNQQAREKLDLALGKIVEEDPTFRVREDTETGQTLISGMGELHLQVVVERLRREYNVQASVGRPQVVYRESIGATAEAAATFERVLKEATLYGQVRCKVAARERGSGRQVVSGLPDGTLPPAIVAAALGGLEEAMETGPDGFPMEDVAATLLAVDYRDDAQPEVGVKAAAGEAFRRAVAEASPFRIEPIMSVEVVVPEEDLGAVIGDLKRRRAQIFDIGAAHDRRLVQARVPLRLMFGYSTDLRSLTKGRATFTMEFHTFDNLVEGQPV
jgi:elongation factor G